MSHVFRKVLCPVDFGPNTGMTIEMARQVAEANLGTVILLHVVPMPIEAIGQKAVSELMERLRHSGEEVSLPNAPFHLEADLIKRESI